MAAAVAPRPVRVSIAESQGLMCAEEVVTEHPLPGFDQAAIDGYAVRSVDVGGAGEIVLPVRATQAQATTQAYIAMHWGPEFIQGGLNVLASPALCPQSRGIGVDFGSEFDFCG